MRRPMKDPGILLKTEARYSSGVQQPTRPMAILSSQPHPYWPAPFAASRPAPVVCIQKAEHAARAANLHPPIDFGCEAKGSGVSLASLHRFR